jgi:hypothetical protein
MAQRLEEVFSMMRLGCCKRLTGACCVVLLLAGSLAGGQERQLRIKVVDADTQQPIAARIYCLALDGTPYFFRSDSANGSAVPYEKQNWINARSTEYHTTVSADPCVAVVPDGRYQLTVERGGAWRGWSETIQLDGTDLDLIVPLHSWADPASRGWYSGDTHLHRTVSELRNVVVAEDLNVALPLTSWVTRSDTPPADGDRNLEDDQLSELIQVGDQHVIWPRNTEYEIFTVGSKRHTLGALFVLGHRQPLEKGVPPWQPVIEEVRRVEPQAVFDMDKLDWPFAMLLPTIVPGALYELANNHTWRTEFAFRNWNTAAPAFLQPPLGSSEGGHRQWLDYTHGMYHTLLNCGLRLPPSAGTANGVHPVPAGFGRVYVHLPEGFSFEGWMDALRSGRSFVSTGPLLFATADGQEPGHVFQLSSTARTVIPVSLEVLSEQPLLYGELLINGRPERLLSPSNQKTRRGAFQTQLQLDADLQRSGWFAIRFWEQRPDGQVRFVHSAPWYVELDSQPVRISRPEKDYLVERMQHEIARSDGVVGPEAMQEYHRALEFYAALPEADDTQQVARTARPASSDEELHHWLDNMVIHHRFTADEVRQATGLSLEEAEQEVRKRADARDARSAEEASRVRLLPYPGGRHPRRGFLEGAVDPQRETKISVFPPWPDSGYVVIDVPEAIFSNLGLIYLAHTHVPTIWEQQSTTLPRLEWSRRKDGLSMRRELPNGIVFASHVRQTTDGVDMQIDLTNGTDQLLTGLRVQVCVMLKGMPGFNVQQPLPSAIDGSAIAVRGEGTDRWIITSWSPIQRVWQNPPVPCIHADPIFPDCPPGETATVSGTLRFYEGADVRAAMQ